MFMTQQRKYVTRHCKIFNFLKDKYLKRLIDNEQIRDNMFLPPNWNRNFILHSF